MARETRQYITLSAFVRRTGRRPDEVLAALPPPIVAARGEDAECFWPTSEMAPLLKRMEKVEEQDIARLQRKRAELEDTITRLSLRVEVLEAVIEEAEAKARILRLAPDAIEASTKQGDEAFWPWEPPMPAPERIKGVYKLIEQGGTAYIGQSVDIMGRVATHTAKKKFDEFCYARVDGGKQALDEVESALIIIERPPGNHGPDGKLRHPVGHGWSQEEAQAVLDKYRASAAVAEDGDTT